MYIGGFLNLQLRQGPIVSSLLFMLRVSSMILVHRASVVIVVATVVFSAPFVLMNMGSVRFARVATTPVITTFLPNIFDAGNLKVASLVEDNQSLKGVLKNAANENNTVILTILNEAWAGPDLLFDLFIESFTIGEDTQQLLNHLVVVTLDQKALVKCKKVHKYCYALFTQGYDFHHEAYFMTPSYLKLVWTRLDFLRSVLEMGYNFVFTDTDILWLRNPFPLFQEDADIQVSCDHFIGRPYDLRNLPNVGFNYVRSNNQSIEFFKFWYQSGKDYPSSKLQDVLNIVRFDTSILSVGIKIKFFDTKYFGGLCSPRSDLNWVYTMHANCCIGLENKLQILKFILREWLHVRSLPADQRNVPRVLEVPPYCRSSGRGYQNYSLPRQPKLRTRRATSGDT